MQHQKASKAAFTPPSAPAEPRTVPQEVRCAVRFPLTLPVSISTDDGEFAARSVDVSATGILFELDHYLALGLPIHFSFRMPQKVQGTSRDVLVHCVGRVVRCSIGQTQYLAAATIDEYRLAEQ
jgi:hypothetical protein